MNGHIILCTVHNTQNVGGKNTVKQNGSAKMTLLQSTQGRRGWGGCPLEKSQRPCVSTYILLPYFSCCAGVVIVAVLSGLAAGDGEQTRGGKRIRDGRGGPRRADCMKRRRGI